MQACGRDYRACCGGGPRRTGCNRPYRLAAAQFPAAAGHIHGRRRGTSWTPNFLLHYGRDSVMVLLLLISHAISRLLGDWDFPPEGAVGIDLIGDDQHKSYDKPRGPDLQAVGVGGGVEDRETVCRLRRRD